MHLKAFEAPTHGEAITSLRRTLGDDAIIIATQELPNGSVRLMAAVETDDDLHTLLAPADTARAVDAVSEALDYHGVPGKVADRILGEMRSTSFGQPVAALAQAIAQVCRFSAVGIDPDRRLMLVGPPGAGKTITIAKLARRAKRAGRAVIVLSGDDDSGAGSRLASRLAPLGIEPLAVRSADRLRRGLEACPDDAVVLIDTRGVNPYAGDDLAALAALTEGARDVEPVLVQPAGSCAADVGETAAIFATFGVRRQITTKVDAARRLGAVLSAAAAGVALAEVGIGPKPCSALSPLTAPGLARIMLRHRPDAQHTSEAHSP